MRIRHLLWLAVLTFGVHAAVARVETSRAALDWKAIDPALSGATFVGDDTVCAQCHDDYLAAYEKTRHARSFSSTGRGNCESCHGPRSLHVDDPGAGEKTWDEIEPAAQSAVCLQCHEAGSRVHWASAAHPVEDVSCSSCHLVMSRDSRQALLIREDSTESCYSCHGDVRAELLRTSHHPVREGRMDCASCHDLHGSVGPAELRGHTVNETCTTCHAEKRGPFLWEHPPVRESCLNCHEAHGSNHRNLLSGKDSFVCLACHSYGGHINLPRYNRTSNPYGQGCVNCHVTTHGSNHPSGAKQTR
ncbi:MAG TPA: DmsE family decaheme c-type cytochrome [Thermoanaerobaculia bacterium]|nr:DmsE family decaheme c-type cytochrome [Thermoanaerobaculia bacterium]